MTIKLNGDAEKLLEDFIRYGKHFNDVAEAMYYSREGFSSRLYWLEEAFLAGKEQDVQ